MEKERTDLRFIQISDLHITSYRNLLEPMLDHINNEDVDFVVATGDIANDCTKEAIKLASKALERIKHEVFVIPGEYDGGMFWVEEFGDRFKSVDMCNYHLEFLDTSFMGHKFASGWANLFMEDKEQRDWFNNRLELENYHIVFSHHPMLLNLSKNNFIRDNLRCVYSGHLHETFKLYFPYDCPQKHFKFGFNVVPLNFHGNSCYLVVSVKSNGDIINVPKIISEKKTAW